MIRIIILFLLLSTQVFADYIPNGEVINEDTQNLSSIQQELQALGSYLGYVLTNPPSPNSVSDNLLYYSSSTSNQEIYEITALIAMFGAMPVDTIQSTLAYFVPTDASNSSSVNSLANLTSNNYQTPSQTVFSAVSNVDAPASSSSTFENDPTSQAVLNILTTNDLSVCNAAASNNNTTSTTTYPIYTSSCISQSFAMQTLMNSNVNQSALYPGVTSFGSYSYVQPFIGQLNANVVLAPLMYTNNSANNTSSSSTSSSGSTGNGLPSSSQADQAADFVRYDIGAPVGLTNYSNYL